MSTVHRDDADGAYWDEATAAHRRYRSGRSWRQHCDNIHRHLLDRWIDGSQWYRALKTDLFDETAHVGLVAHLAAVVEVVHAVDISAAVSLEATVRNPGLRCSRADVRALPYRDGSFDMVMSNSTLDHFPRRSDISGALRELRRVTAVGGTVVVTMDNFANPVIRLRSVLPFALLRLLRIVPYYVGATLTEEGLVGELEQAGFRVEETRTVLHAPRVAAMMACRVVDALSRERIANGLLRFLRAAERMDRLRFRNRTGYYVAARATPVGELLPRSIR